MRLVSFTTDTAGLSWGLLRGDDILDVRALATLSGRESPQDVFALLSTSTLGWVSDLVRSASTSDIAQSTVSGSSVRLVAPIRPGKIVAVGRNYLDHLGEASIKPPLWPKLFPKFPSTVIGHGDDIVKPTMTEQLDFEVEVGVVIGSTATKVQEADAMSYVAGYTILNDVSARDIQFTDEQITLGKNFDTFTPMGPAITTCEDLPDPAAIALRLRLNGEVMQESNTRHLIFSIPYLVSFISYAMTLEPGDIISTGTPSGVGMARQPWVWLEDGDEVTVASPQLGELRTSIAR